MRMRVSGPLLASWCGLLYLMLLTAAWSAEVPATEQAAQPTGGLRLTLSPDRSAGATHRMPEFIVAFENVGPEDTFLNLGTMLANGRFQIPDRIWLRLIDHDGRATELRFIDKEHGGIAGRVDNYPVPLRRGSTYLLRLRLEDFFWLAPGELPPGLSGGRYQLSVRYEGSGTEYNNIGSDRIPALPYWKGIVQSNVLAFGR